MERKVVLNRGARLDGFHLEGSADVREGRRAEWQRLGMVLLPSLVFGAEIKGSGVLQVRGEHNSLVAGFSGKLHAKVPGIERHEDKIEVLRREVL